MPVVPRKSSRSLVLGTNWSTLASHARHLRRACLRRPTCSSPAASPARVTVLSGGVGGARFLQGLLRLVERTGADTRVTVIANTADDIWVHGLKVCPDLDTVMYTLGDGIDPERGWGRTDETWNAKDELAAYGVEPTWFGLGDRDIATHLVRTQMLDAGYPLSAVTAALCQRWLAVRGGVELLPMTDDRVETHVVIDDPETGERQAVHFQEYWVRHQAPRAGPRGGAGRHRGGQARARACSRPSPTPTW